MMMKSVVYPVAAFLLIACAGIPRTADNITLARVAKDYIGVGSIDEMEISNVQKIPVEGGIFAVTHYRYNVDTARKKKFICDVKLTELKADGTPFRPDQVKCETR